MLKGLLDPRLPPTPRLRRTGRGDDRERSFHASVERDHSLLLTLKA